MQKRGDEKPKVVDLTKRVETAQDYRQFTKNWAMKPNADCRMWNEKNL
jgi:hypothetical protein